MIEFAALIVSHRRAARVLTYNSLRQFGYNGAIFVVVDDEDLQLVEYKEKFGDELIVFSKEKYEGLFDKGDNFAKRNSVIYARNAIWDIARQKNIKAFVMLDDDYGDWRYRFDDKLKYYSRQIKSLGAVFARIIRAMYKAPQISCIAIGQGGDYIGGSESTSIASLKTKRKLMNAFFCITERAFPFFGRMNDDVNTYVALQRAGANVFYTTMQVSLNQSETQLASGGLTEMYKENGTYVKSFYTVMYAPSCAIIDHREVMGRFHHKINWKACAPCIIREKYRKAPRC